MFKMKDYIGNKQKLLKWPIIMSARTRLEKALMKMITILNMIQTMMNKSYDL